MITALQQNKQPPQQIQYKLFSIAQQCRRDIAAMLTSVHSSHLGCSFSIIDILVTLYHAIVDVQAIAQLRPERDYIILSKGHGASALYAALASVNLIPPQMLTKYHQGFLSGHQMMNPRYGIESSAGSLGHGPSIAVGMALAAKHDNFASRFFVIVGDGECQEGSVWEAITMAVRLELSNITFIIDYNNLQGLDRSDDIATEPLDNRFKAFGCHVTHSSGHDFEELTAALTKQYPLARPHVIIAHTIKAKGVDFMENKLEWHYKSCKPEEYAAVTNILEQ